jgi:AcrR family transcriptional regulator
MARPRRIDRAAVLRASLAIADEAGLDAVTMQAVADRLGVTPMALYRHVDSKGDLLDGVVESMLDEIPVPPADLPWDQQLAGMGRSLREVARRHPAVFPLLLQLPAKTPRARSRREQVYAALREAGVAPQHIERVERIVSTVALGYAASEVSGRFGGHSSRTIDGDHRALETFVRAGLQPFITDQPDQPATPD